MGTDQNFLHFHVRNAEFRRETAERAAQSWGNGDANDQSGRAERSSDRSQCQSGRPQRQSGRSVAEPTGQPHGPPHQHHHPHVRVFGGHRQPTLPHLVVSHHERPLDDAFRRHGAFISLLDGLFRVFFTLLSSISVIARHRKRFSVAIISLNSIGNEFHAFRDMHVLLSSLYLV